MTTRPPTRTRPFCLLATIALVWCLGLMWAAPASAQVPGGLPGSDVTGSVGDTVGDAVGDTTGTVSDTVDGVTDMVDGALDPVDDAVGDSPVGDVVGGVDDTVEGVTDTVDETVGGITETVGGVVDETAETVDEVTDEVDGATGGATDPVTDVVDDVVDQAAGEAGGLLPGAGGNLPGAAGRPLGGGSRSDSVADGAAGGLLEATGPGTAASGAPAARRQQQARHEGGAGSDVDRRTSAPRLTPVDAFAQALSPASRAVLEAARAAELSDGKPGILSRVADGATELARRVAFPLTLLLIVGGFLALQNRLDRNDPKLALAPVDQSQEVLYFE